MSELLKNTRMFLSTADKGKVLSIGGTLGAAPLRS
jgi:hypothetical protein